MSISLPELFTSSNELNEVPSGDKTVMQKVKLMEALPHTERATLYAILDAFVSKKT